MSVIPLQPDHAACPQQATRREACGHDVGVGDEGRHDEAEDEDRPDGDLPLGWARMNASTQATRTAMRTTTPKEPPAPNYSSGSATIAVGATAAQCHPGQSPKIARAIRTAP